MPATTRRTTKPTARRVRPAVGPAAAPVDVLDPPGRCPTCSEARGWYCDGTTPRVVCLSCHRYGSVERPPVTAAPKAIAFALSDAITVAQNAALDLARVTPPSADPDNELWKVRQLLDVVFDFPAVSSFGRYPDAPADPAR